MSALLEPNGEYQMDTNNDLKTVALTAALVKVLRGELLVTR